MIGVMKGTASCMTRAAQTRHLIQSWLKCCLHNLASSTRNSVYISSSQSIFHNLAVEDWIYNNVDFSKRHFIVLLWRNKPCIVTGRHQNVWAECDVNGCQRAGIDVARRRSGGGTVFHDLGNLNCTVFSHIKDYNRERNLKLVASVLQSNWKLDVSVSDRDDLLLDSKYKISGTGAKLGGKVAYHHFTLLIDVHSDNLYQLLTSPMYGLESKATESVPSKVCNLKARVSSMTIEKIMEEIAQTFQTKWQCQGPIQYIDPNKEAHFPGITKLYQELKHWNWVFAKTPPFSLQQTMNIESGDDVCEVNLRIEIDKGMIKDITFESTNLAITEALKKCSVVLCGMNLDIHAIEEKLMQLSNENELDTTATALMKSFKSFLR